MDLIVGMMKKDDPEAFGLKRKPRVYVVHEPMRRNPASGRLEPIFDLTPASEYGDMVPVLPAGQVAFDPRNVIQEADRVLSDFGEGDYLLAVGDPVAISIASAIAAGRNAGRYKLLKWDRHSRRYLVVQVDLGRKA